MRILLSAAAVVVVGSAGPIAGHVGAAKLPGRLVFSAYYNITGPHEYDGPALFVMRPDGTHLRQLTRGYAYDPAWSPDGRRVVFGRRRNLFMIDATGRHLHQLTRGRHGDIQPTWSPDGRRVAFVRAESGHPPWRIWSLDLKTKRSRPISRGRWDQMPTWSPNGQRLAYVAGDADNPPYDRGTIVIVNRNGSHRRLVTGNVATYGAIAWSNDNRITFTAWEPWLTIQSVGLDARDVTTIGIGLFESWSPDHRALVATNDTEETEAPSGEVWIEAAPNPSGSFTNITPPAMALDPVFTGPSWQRVTG